MRIAILGRNGFIGAEFLRLFRQRGIDFVALGRRECDVYNQAALTTYVKNISPDALINCSGYTGKPNVDACESDRANCLAANTVLPGVVAATCSELNLPWGHVSSGCIFTGRRDDGQPFAETDPPNFSFRQNNCSFYSGTKALGEEVLSDAQKCFIWRLRIPFLSQDCPRNYLSKVMNYATLLDAENSLSDLSEFVAACVDCFENRVPFGTYNLTNPGSITTREVVNLILESGKCNKEFKFFESETDFMAKAAITPRSNCVLDSSKAISSGLKLTEIHAAIRQALANWHTQA